MPVDFIVLFAVLAAATVRYVVVGDLAPDAEVRTVSALTESGYRPLAPVQALER